MKQCARNSVRIEYHPPKVGVDRSNRPGRAIVNYLGVFRGPFYIYFRAKFKTSKKSQKPLKFVIKLDMQPLVAGFLFI